LPLEFYQHILLCGQIGLLLYLVKRNRESLQVLGLRHITWWAELEWAFVIYIAAEIIAGIVYSTAASFGAKLPRAALYVVTSPDGVLATLAAPELAAHLRADLE